MTPEVLRSLCKKNNLYFTPKLNDVLYLHYQGFQEIASLEEYTGLKCLWLECNAITELQGLDNQTELRCLFLQNNLIKKIENLHHCTQLDTLNLSHNQLRRVENVSSATLPVLTNLTISHNYIRTAADVEELTMCLSLSVLDLSHNKIDDILVVKILARIPNLRVLTLVGNPIVALIPSYRKTLILECQNLTYLDTRPVFAKDRALAEAWKRGGLQAEKEENERWNREERRKMRENINRVLRRRNEIKGQEITELIHSSSDEEEIKQSQDIWHNLRTTLVETIDTREENGENEGEKEVIKEEKSSETPNDPETSDPSDSTTTEEEITVKIPTNHQDNESQPSTEEHEKNQCTSSNWIIPEIRENLADDPEETADDSRVSTTATANSTVHDFSSNSQSSQTSSSLISILSITLPHDSFQSTPKHKIEVAPKYQKNSPARKPREFHSTLDEFMESCEQHLEEERVESERLFQRYSEEVDKSFQEISADEEKETLDVSSVQDFEKEIEEIGAKVHGLNEARMEQFREDNKEVKELIDGVFDKVNKRDEEARFKEDCKAITNKLEKLSAIIEKPPVNQFDELLDKFCGENMDNWATDSKMKKIEKFLNTIESSAAIVDEASAFSPDENIQIEDIEFSPPSGEITDHKKVSKDEVERENEKSLQD
ncbi:dynein axonemal assembly factor 1 homolog [Phlebotomus argentipes]|uniref:dynein axonemal assembly factor 1 homolog n=1 Tax=Phlebotomus argentipes TaxID=94469 RepID=UPI002893832A|nr:dynein axonemal assembly factor 1 homolog [Phlebotomus argentipes]